MNSSQKIQQRWFPTIDDALAQNADTALMSFSLAAWVLYVQKALESEELEDPLRYQYLSAHQQDSHQQGQDIVQHCLAIAGADRFRFFHSTAFMGTLLNDYKTLENTEITSALRQFLSRREEVSHA